MDKILTTHVGSLPRSAALLELMQGADAPERKAEIDRQLTSEVDSIVARQVATGIDLVSDGELSKPSYATYVTERLTGFGGEWRGHVAQDLAEFRDLAVHLVKTGAVVPTAGGACCQGDVHMRGHAALEQDIANFKAAVARHKPAGAFLNAASPGVVAVFQKNEFYPDDDAYIEAVAGAMQTEYEAIVEAGFELQLDCPDLAMGRHLGCADLSEAEFLTVVSRNVAALNEATRNIPAERMRMHLCWGNYPGPHHRDIALEKILPEVLRARPRYLLLEAANPRHAHEHELFRTAQLPEDKVLVPGVIDSTSNYIEHPELVAQRICQFADIVGRERVLAGSDCGFSTFSGFPTVYPDIVWEKLASLVEGARRATARLWNRRQTATGNS